MNCPACTIKGVEKQGETWYLGLNICLEHEHFPLYKYLEYYAKKDFTDVIRKHTLFYHKDNPEILEMYRKEWNATT